MVSKVVSNACLTPPTFRSALYRVKAAIFKNNHCISASLGVSLMQGSNKGWANSWCLFGLKSTSLNFLCIVVSSYLKKTNDILYDCHEHGLIHPRMASEECHIPQLPVELLECIMDSLSPNDILSFRLACKTFTDISFDKFASWYIEEINCFFPDPARVQRLANITSQPHLARRMRTIYFTLDAFEYNDDEITFVAPAHDRGEAFAEYKDAYRTEQVGYHCARRPSFDLLSQSLRQLNPLWCRLHLDLANIPARRYHTQWVWISQRVFAAIEKALYPIYDLTILSFRDTQQPINRPQNQRVLPTRTPYDQLYCTPIHSAHIDDPPWERFPDNTYQQSLAAMLQAAAVSQDSESLDIIHWIWPRQASSIAAVANEVLSVDRWTQLKRLTLVHVILPTFGNLFQRIRRCELTLEIIRLSEVEASGHGREWRELFEMLSVLPKLEHLHVEHLWWSRDDEQSLLIGDADTFIEFRCRESGNASIRGAVMEILQKGLVVQSRAERIKLW